MKTLLAFALTCVTLASAQAAPVLEATRTPGFEPRPQSRSFVLEESGRMTLTVENFPGHGSTVTVLGQLSQAAMATVLHKIAAIDSGLPLKDEKEGQPMCTDTPSYFTAVYQNGVKKEISRSAGCHEWNVASGEAYSLEALAGAFLNF